jgi:hypothetical protein
MTLSKVSVRETDPSISNNIETEHQRPVSKHNQIQKCPTDPVLPYLRLQCQFLRKHTAFSVQTLVGYYCLRKCLVFKVRIK